MNLDDHEKKRFTSIVEHAVFGLHREALIDGVEYGLDHVNKLFQVDISEDALVFAPSVLGAELFMKAHGAADESVQQFLLPELKLEFQTQVEIQEGAKRTVRKK